MLEKFRKLLSPMNKNKELLNENKPCDEIITNRLAINSKSLNYNDEKEKKVLSLTPREHDVYHLLLDGFSLKECAEKLSIKYSTANTHMTGVYRKLGINTRAELIINYRDIK